MKLKELEKPYKAETHRDHFTKAQDLITSAIFSGWKIDFEAWTDEYSSGFSYIDSDFPGHWYAETKICAKNFVLKTRTTIDCCPKCGRLLNEEEE